MKCPKCGHDLREIMHQEVAIDICDECDGIWLDAGELELLQGAGGGGFLSKFLKKKK